MLIDYARVSTEDQHLHMHEVWKQLDQKYQSLPENKKGHDRRLTPEEGENSVAKMIKQFGQERVEQAATVIQKHWRHLQSKDTLLLVNPKGNHTNAFHFVLNAQPAKKSLNQKKLTTLDNVIQHGDWRHKIFLDKTLPQLALSLYAANRISQQQFYTVIELWQIEVRYWENKQSLLASEAILDEQGNFTNAAKTILLPMLQKKKATIDFYPVFKQLSNRKLEAFRLLIKALPRSEQYFFHGRIYAMSSLGKRLIDHLEGILIYEPDLIYPRKLIHFSAGARDALALARFGVKEYVRPILRLGQLTREDIEEGVRHYARYGALDFPKVKSHQGTLHEHKHIYSMEATQHDVYHSHVMSCIPNELLTVLWKMADLIRETFQIKWSKEIWDFIDCEYNYRLKNHAFIKSTHNTDECYLTIEFSKMFVKNPSSATQLVTNGYTPTLCGLVIFTDMLQNPEVWKNKKINPKYFIGDLKIGYQNVEKLYPLIKHNSLLTKAIKCNIFLSPQFLMHFEKSIKTLSVIIDSIKNIESEFKIIKLKKLNTMNLVSTGSTLLETIMKVLNMYYLQQHPEASPELLARFRQAVLEQNLNLKQAEAYPVANQNLVRSSIWKKVDVSFAEIKSEIKTETAMKLSSPSI